MTHCYEHARFPDLHNPPKPRWREVVKALVGPANRLHHYRDMHARMVDEVLRERDCGGRS
jgi:hypothetical protein